jgi:hypothetical protein
MDRYLEKQEAETPKEEYQQVTSGALYLASKYNDIDFIDVHDLIEHLSEVTRTDVLAMERKMLICLDFNLTFPTVHLYLTRLN